MGMYQVHDDSYVHSMGLINQVLEFGRSSKTGWYGKENRNMVPNEPW